MTTKHKNLSFDGCVDLVTQMVNDFVLHAKDPNKIIPNKKTFTVEGKDESSSIVGSARLAAYNSILNEKSIKKVAFDTRRIDQKLEGNPRVNLQYYNRSQQFIDAEKHKKIITFAKLMPVLDVIQKEYGDQPEYFQSYAMSLHDLVSRALRIKEEDLEVFSPQLNYLEQLLFARYRLSMEEISKLGNDKLKKRILSKDESLLKRGNYLDITGGNDAKKNATSHIIMKDGDKPMQESIINAIFGNNDFRRDGEKKVTRTITISISDEVKDE